MTTLALRFFLPKKPFLYFAGEFYFILFFAAATAVRNFVPPPKKPKTMSPSVFFEEPP
jgi:hypothetical protein